MKITLRQIAELTRHEQQQMARWIGESSCLAELDAAACRRRAVQQAIQEEENDNGNEPDDL